MSSDETRDTAGKAWLEAGANRVPPDSIAGKAAAAALERQAAQVPAQYARMGEAMQAMGKAIGEYYTSLVTNGVPPELAGSMAKEAHDQLMVLMKQGAENELAGRDIARQVAGQ